MLHTINKSPTERPSLLSCLRLAKAGSDILLIEDAVYAALSGTKFAEIIENSLNHHQFFVLEADLDCRGFGQSELIDGITMVDYTGFVSLAVKNDKVQAWL